METPSSNEKLDHDEYIKALNRLINEDIAKQKEIFDLLKDKKIGPEEFATKTQERDNEFHTKQADLTQRVG